METRANIEELSLHPSLSDDLKLLGGIAVSSIDPSSSKLPSSFDKIWIDEYRTFTNKIGNNIKDKSSKNRARQKMAAKSRRVNRKNK